MVVIRTNRDKFHLWLVFRQLDEITIINHGYQSGQIVNYYSTGDDIGGLSTGQDYFVTKVDENNFKLSLVVLESPIETLIMRMTFS